jgi:hypothetical protein
MSSEEPQPKQDGYIPLQLSDVMKEGGHSGGGIIVGAGLAGDFAVGLDAMFGAGTHSEAPKKVVTPPSQEDRQELFQQKVDYLNKLEVFEMQENKIPGILTPDQKDLAERVKSDFDTYNMVIVATEMGSERDGVEELLAQEQLDAEIAALEEMRAGYQELRDQDQITDEHLQGVLSGIDADIADLKDNGAVSDAYSSREFVQVTGNKVQKIKIYYGKNWQVKSLVPRGYHKPGQADFNAARNEGAKRLPLEGTLWRSIDYSRREDPKIQPSVVLGSYSTSY